MKNLFNFLTLLCLVVIIVVTWSSCKTSEKSQLTTQSRNPAHDTILFALNQANNICVPVVLNDADSLVLMFHLGAGSIAMTTEGCLQALSIVFDDTAHLHTWGGQEQSRYSSSNQLKIGNRIWKQLSITEDRHSGPNTHGKFGWNLFEKGILEVNFDEKLLLYHRKLPKDFVNYEKLDVRIEGSNIFLTVGLQMGLDKIDHEFLVHSGYGGSLLLDDAFVAKHDVGSKLKSIGQRDLKDSMGNIIITKKAQMPGFSIGQHVLTDVPIGFFEGAIGRQKMSVLGCDILRRFNFLFDFSQEKMYVQPAQDYSVAYTQ